jgi:hypothetical protein
LCRVVCLTAASQAGQVACRSCHESGAAGNFCGKCGAQVAAAAARSDHVARARGELYLSHRAPSAVARFADGSWLLATVLKRGKKLFLVCSPDKSEVKWTE